MRLKNKRILAGYMSGVFAAFCPLGIYLIIFALGGKWLTVATTIVGILIFYLLLRKYPSNEDEIDYWIGLFSGVAVSFSFFFGSIALTKPLLAESRHSSVTILTRALHHAEKRMIFSEEGE